MTRLPAALRAAMPYRSVQFNRKRAAWEIGLAVFKHNHYKTVSSRWEAKSGTDTPASIGEPVPAFPNPASPRASGSRVIKAFDDRPRQTRSTQVKHRSAQTPQSGPREPGGVGSTSPECRSFYW